MFNSANTRLSQIAKRAGVEYTESIELFAEMIAEECAEIADTAWQVNLSAAPVIRRHFNLIEPKK
jgi:histone H3/H4